MYALEDFAAYINHKNSDILYVTDRNAIVAPELLGICGAGFSISSFPASAKNYFFCLL